MMPDRCCVPSCKSNFNGSKEYVSVFQFPNDEILREEWLKSLHIKDFVPGKRSVVCEKHFAEKDVVWTEELPQNGKIVIVQRCRPRLKPRAVPTRFLGSTGDKPKRKFRRKTPSAADSATKVFKNKRRKPNPSTSQVNPLPSIESSRSIVDDTDSSTSSFLDPNIVIKQEILEDEVPNVSAQHSDRAGNALLEPHIIKLEKSPSDPILPTIPALVVSDSGQPILAEVLDASSIRGLNISELLVNAKTMSPGTYSIVNLSNNLIKIADSSPGSVAEKEADDSKACSTADASTSTDGKVKDQFDAYGKYIAAKLRNMDPKTCAFVQKSFGDIIFKVEMDKFLLEED